MAPRVRAQVGYPRQSLFSNQTSGTGQNLNKLFMNQMIMLEKMNDRGYSVEVTTNKMGMPQLIVDGRWSFVFAMFSELHYLEPGREDFPCVEVFDMKYPVKDVEVFRKGDSMSDLIAFMERVEEYED